MRVPCIAVAASALLAAPAFGGQDAATPIGSRPDQSAVAPLKAPSDAVQSFRADFERIVAYYASFFEKIGDDLRYQLAVEARETVRALPDEQIAAAFSGSRLPDLTLAVQAVERLERLPVTTGRRVQPGRTPGFPDKPQILGFCDVLPPHDALARSITLGAFQAARTLLAGAEFACLQNAPPPVCVNTSILCVALSVAKDLAEVPLEWLSFCAGEDDSALLQGNYDRLAHIHADIDAALSEIRRLSCDLLRIMHTPEGLRQSDIQSCVGQPGFPYNFPER